MKNYTIEIYTTFGSWALPISFEIWGSQLGYKAWTKDFTIHILFINIDFIKN
jgi:hypothetical protein